MRRALIARALAGLILFVSSQCPAVAGSFAVNPVRLTLSADRTIDAITVRNQGTDAAVLHVEPVAWTQTGEHDLYTPTQELLATPPIFTVPAGGSQIVRVGLRRTVEPQRELSYRLFFQEVPPPAKVGFQGLRVALRIGVPVFVPPASGPSAPRVHWQIAQMAPDTLKLRATNAGQAHVQVIRLKLSSPQDQALVTQAVATTLLTGQSRDWRLELPHPLRDSRLHLTASTSEGEMDGGLIAVQAK